MKCENCHKRPATRGALLDGKFGRYCNPCIGEKARQHSPLSAQWHRDRDIEDARRDMLQPRDHRGHPNPEFIRNYPEESKEIFTEDEIQKSGS